MPESFWDKVKPGDPVMNCYGAIIDTQDAPDGTPITLVPRGDGTYRYYYDPNREVEGTHMIKATDSQGVYWKEPTE